MKKYIPCLLLVCLLSSFVSCSYVTESQQEQTSSAADELQSESLSQSSKSASSENIYPLYFPMPYYRAFSREPESGSIDAFLHNSAVNYYAARVDAREGAFLIPSLRILDEWDCDDGATYYLCFIAEYDFYDLATEIIESAGEYRIPTAVEKQDPIGTLIRFKVFPFDYTNNSVTNYWGFQMLEILEQPPWGTDWDTFSQLCGNRPISDKLYEAYGGAISKADIPYIRDIFPDEYSHDKYELLRRYLNSYFPDTYIS